MVGEKIDPARAPRSVFGLMSDQLRIKVATDLLYEITDPALASRLLHASQLIAFRANELDRCNPVKPQLPDSPAFLPLPMPVGDQIWATSPEDAARSSGAFPYMQTTFLHTRPTLTEHPKGGEGTGSATVLDRIKVGGASAHLHRDLTENSPIWARLFHTAIYTLMVFIWAVGFGTIAVLILGMPI